MAAGEVKPRPADDRPAPRPTVRRSTWSPEPRNVKALDRYIEQLYGRDAAARSRR